MPFELDFTVIPDPNGFGRALLLRGDWVFVRISAGSDTGLGEATHSGDDERCIAKMRELFARHVRDLRLDLDAIRELEAGAFAAAPDRLSATAISGINQALYDLLARRNGVPVWRLFVEKPARRKLPLYATINRALTARTADDYREVLARVAQRGFTAFKCAPFERVTPGCDQVGESREGLSLLRLLQTEFPGLTLRVDFHQRFTPETFLRILPAVNEVSPYWIEEPFAIGPAYREVKENTASKLAAGELYFGTREFRRIVANGWADVIMPDVKHVGGFGPLLRVCELAAGRGIEVSPHNPSGPISTAASLHAAAIHANVASLEYPFDRDCSRACYGEPIDGGAMTISDRPGWGVEVAG